MRIIVIEDEVKTRNGIVNLIGKIDEDYKVIGEAGNAYDGIRLIKDRKPDLVITDIKMSEMDGLEMLKHLKAEAVNFKTIILSGYAEFEFAKTAIELGVQEYLLKPITVDDLDKSLRNVDAVIKSEKKFHLNHLSDLSSKEHFLKEIITGNFKVDNETVNLLKDILKIENNLYPECFLIKVKNHAGYQNDEIRQRIEHKLDDLNICDFITIDLNMCSEIIIFILKHQLYTKLEEHFSGILKDLHVQYSGSIIAGSATISEPSMLMCSVAALREKLKWVIVLGEEVLISDEVIGNSSAITGQYPNQLEKKTVSSLYSNDIEGFHKYTNEFLHLWKKDFYTPSNVIESFIRFMTSMINAVKETNYELYKQINQKEILNEAITAAAWGDIKNVFTGLVEKITSGNQNNLRYNLIISKALTIIMEKYKDGITLEETAEKLHITPEYLSSLFYKEKGQNFTLFLKEFRIKKAKELIMTTNMKIYEIALNTGYSDPKYFCRVFKEVTGLSPGEYSKMYKIS